MAPSFGRPVGTLTLVPALLPASTLALGAGFGALYAVSAYMASPVLLPVVVLGLAAILLGLWRLEYGLALLVVVTPFAENASIAEPGQAPLRLALVLWALVLVAIQMARAVADPGRHLSAPPLFWGAAAYLGAALLAVPGAADAGAAASKLLLLTGAIVLYGLVALFLHDWSRLKPLLWAIVLAGLVVAGHAIFQKLTGQVSRVGYLSSQGEVEFRVTSAFPHPNQLAGFLAILVPVCVGIAAALRTRVALLACSAVLVMALIAIAFTASRGALVGLAALPLLFLRDRRSWPVIAGGLVVITLAAPDLYSDRIAGISALDQPEIAQRIDLWQAAGEISSEHLLLGAGLDNFPIAYLEAERPGRTFIGGGFELPPTAHNLYLNTLAEQGLLGLTALLVLIFAFLRTVWRLSRSTDPRIRGMARGLLGAGIVLAVHNVFDVTFSDAKSATLVWVLLGVAAALARIDAQTGTVPRQGIRP